MAGSKFSMPALTMGTVFYGTKVNRQTAFSLMDRYVEKGGNWLDTARVYGVGLFPPEERKPEFKDSEETVGAWLRERKNRDKITLVTKGAHWNLETKEKRVCAQAIQDDIATSLKNLGTETIDIYFLHNDDEAVPVEEIMPTLHQLVTQGKVRVLGASNWRAERIQQANVFAHANGLTPFEISQVKWSYALPADLSTAPAIDMERDANQYNAYRNMQMPIMAYSSQAGGFFEKGAKNGFTPEGLGKAASFFSPENLKRAEAVMRICREKGISPSAAAFSYLWSREIPVTALIGCSSMEHLESSMKDCDFAPDEEVIRVLEEAR